LKKGDSIVNSKNRLKELIARDAVKFGKFTLSSGKESDIYVDLRKVTLNPEGAILIGDVVSDMIMNVEGDAIGGMTMGADPIALATSMKAFEKGRKINAIVVRKEQKAHGTMNWVEGPVTPGQKVIVVEDVITTGGSASKAIDRLRENGFIVDTAVAIFDRMEGGKEAIEAKGCRVLAVLTRKDLEK
jgi:orotate phosphoribosyltransferase